MIIIWMLYSVNGFRPPTSPIVLTDENGGSGMRQMIFAGSGMIAIRRLAITGSAASVIRARFPELALLGFLMFSAAWSEVPALTIKRSLVFGFGLITLMTATHMARHPVQLMQRIVFGFTASIAWISLAGWVALPRNCVENPARPGLAGIAGHPNTLAPFLVLGFIVSLGFTSKGKKLIGQRFGQVGQLIATVMTGSMTSLSLLVVCIAMYTYLIIDRSRRGAVHIGMAVVGTYIGIVGPDQAKGDVLAAMGRDASLSGRGELWARIGEQISLRPILGCGFGAFWTEGKGRELVHTWNPRQSHHAYLDVLTDLGAVGLVIVLLSFPIRAIVRWQDAAGPCGSQQRSAAASMTALSIGVMSSYGFAQSFYFKMDSIPFFFLVWCMLLLTNSTSTRLDNELGGQGVTRTPRRLRLSS